MKAIYERELRSYFTSMTGWLFCAFLLFFGGLYTNILNLSSGYAQFEYVLSSMSFAFLIVTPIITMRTVAEERRQKTDQLLYSLPITMTQVILGKYLALLTVLAVPTGVMAFYPVVLSQFGSVSYATAYSSLLGFFLMGAALVAVGLCISAFTENQAVAAALCFVVVLLNYYLTSISTFVSSTPPVFPAGGGGGGVFPVAGGAVDDPQRPGGHRGPGGGGWSAGGRLASVPRELRGAGPGHHEQTIPL